jgi:hypothetical protein
VQRKDEEDEEGEIEGYMALKRGLKERPLSVSFSSSNSTPSLRVAFFKPSRLSRRFQLAAGADSAELDDEFEEVEQGVAGEESEAGPVEVLVLSIY